MRILRSSFNPLPLVAVITLAAALTGAPAAQQPPAGQPPTEGRGFGGQGRGGRGTPIKPGEQCPPGTTEIRPRSLPGARDAGADDPRLPAAFDAR